MSLCSVHAASTLWSFFSFTVFLTFVSWFYLQALGISCIWQGDGHLLHLPLAVPWSKVAVSSMFFVSPHDRSESRCGHLVISMCTCGYAFMLETSVFYGKTAFSLKRVPSMTRQLSAQRDANCRPLSLPIMPSLTVFSDPTLALHRQLGSVGRGMAWYQSP